LRALGPTAGGGTGPSRGCRCSTETGRFVGYRGLGRHITERKRVEERLRESEQRYRNIFETAGVSIWEEDFSEVKAAIESLKAQGVRDFRQYIAAHPEFVRQAVAMVKIVDVNDATVKLFGATSKETCSVPCRPSSRRRRKKYLQRSWSRSQKNGAPSHPKPVFGP